MNVRKYIVSDMQEGFDRIRRELGRDAVILNQRTVRTPGLAGWFSRPRLEIYVAYEDIPAPAAAQAPAQAAPQPCPAPPAAAPRPWPEQPALASQPQPRARTAYPAQAPQSASPAAYAPAALLRPQQQGPVAPEWTDSLIGRLLAGDVHPEVAAVLAGQARRIAAVSGEDARRVLHRLVMDRLGGAPALQAVPGRRKRILFTGPTGVGKTTTVLKLAAELSRQPGVSVGLLSADFSRAGAHGQLVALGRLLRLPVAIIQSGAEAPAACAQLDSCDLVLIDTAGCNPLDAEQRDRLQEQADWFQPDETWLCLSASTSYSACRRMVDQFRFLDGYRLIVTKTDEAPESGAVLNISSLAGRPPAYLTDGQQVPGQIRTCDARQIADRMMG